MCKNPFRVHSVCISTEKGTVKTPVPGPVRVTPDGLDGDAHAGPWHRQVSLLSREQVLAFQNQGSREIRPGEFAENILTEQLDSTGVAILDEIVIGPVRLQITQIGKPCHHGCAILKEMGACIMPKDGLFARVLAHGTIQAGDTGMHILRPTRIHIITLSDRAAAGTYSDRSGPAAESLCREYFQDGREHLDIHRSILPDEPDRFAGVLEEAAPHADIIISTGSTGIGPRDMAPDVTADVCDKLIPGIMDYARLTFGAKFPGALLTRGVAGIRHRCFIVNLPGSVNAVTEYVPEVLRHWRHIRRMLHGIDQH